MSDDHPIDALVRDRLQREAAGVDARALLARVRRRMRVPPPTRRRALLALAASVLAVLALLERPGATLRAAPEALLRQAQSSHADGADRCYRVRTEWEPALVRRFPLLTAPRSTRLWTRGDRYLIEAATPAGRVVAWGRDEAGRVWLAPSRRLGLLYEPDELTQPLRVAGDLFGMQVDRLLGETLARFRLTRDPADPYRVRAVPRGHWEGRQLDGIDLTIDPRGRFLRRVELRRLWRGEQAATVTFEFERADARPDGDYLLSGHLDAGAVIWGRERARARDALAATLAGPLRPARGR